MTRSGPVRLEEAVLHVLRGAYPEGRRAADICSELGLRSAEKGFADYLTDSVIKRLEAQGFVERLGERGQWRLVVT